MTTDLTTATPTTSRVLPPGFLVGAATAAFQIEGAAWTDGRTDSIWDAFCRQPGAVLNGDDGSVAVDHYHRYRTDVALMSELGLDAYRFSTSWARVRPDDGPTNAAGLAFYSRLVDELLENGIDPWLTLYHWDLPQALQEKGGWTHRDTAYRFAEYAVAVHEALGDRVRSWITLNEPWCSSFLAHAAGEHAPGRTEPTEAVAAAHHLLLGHGLAVEALRERDADAALGITLNFTVADPADPADPADVDAARRVDGAFNRIFLDPIFRGTYPADVLEDMAAHWPADLVRDGDLATVAAPVDFLGVNYYNGGAVAGPGTDGEPAAPVGGRQLRSPYVGSEQVRALPRGLPRTAMDWEVQPDGLYRLLTRLQEEYTGPAGTSLYVTENGAAYDDEPDSTGFVQDDERLDYVRTHLAAVLDAVQAGADVRGYFVWSLLDNFEWAFGYAKRFGIVRVDYDTLERTPKASARWYAEVARTRTLEGPARPDVTGP
ncbi:GH1 family beta-glucosidase [Georgenia subflava]|uniref:Beta-glucosidase n=1 Tax=Georgenia subflava TaxID=1622177 RepID=A0A6N7EGK7_9MICO|nr:GH1 family beta-glucosidase [Georgenia subflava]MPV37512.1 beta-glucosidase [Georgenia subflava]